MVIYDDWADGGSGEVSTSRLGRTSVSITRIVDNCNGREVALHLLAFRSVIRKDRQFLETSLQFFFFR